MSRSPRDLLFKHTDIVRAYKAAKAAGVPHPRIEINKHGTISIVAGDPPKDNGTAPPNDTPESIIEQL
jgi:hypothetical protein